MVNSKCPLVLSNCFEYDFSSCFYSILKGIGWDLSQIDALDKKSRNMQIGYIQRENPRVAEYLQGTVTRLIDHYLRENGVDETEVILRQKDGITLTRRLAHNNTTMTLELRGIISKLIIDVTRRRWLIIYADGTVVVKGITRKVKNMDFFNMFRGLDYSNKASLVSGLERIRQKIFSTPDISWFLQEEDDGAFSVPITGVGFITISRSSVSSISPGDIDRQFLWEEYIWPFGESILIHCSA